VIRQLLARNKHAALIDRLHRNPAMQAPTAGLPPFAPDRLPPTPGMH
jgi:hypothetical protein